MTRHINLFLIAFCTLSALPATAQTREYARVHSGLRAFKHGDTETASARFEKAEKANPNSSRVLFALGNVALQAGQDSVALTRFQQAADNERNKMVKALNFHNIGTVHYAHACSGAQELENNEGTDLQQAYNEAIKACTTAIEAYKESLRNNPNDEDTRYNLALAQHLLKRLQEKQPQNDENNKKNEENNESNQGNNNQNDDQNNDQDNNGGNNGQDRNDQNKQSQESEEENYEQLLELSRQAEEQARQRIQNAQRRPARRLEKNW